MGKPDIVFIIYHRIKYICIKHSKLQITKKSHRFRWLEVAGSIEISNQLISDMLEFVDVAEGVINSSVMKKNEFSAN